MRDLPTRKSVRLESFHYRGEKRHFVTICSYRRKEMFVDVERAAKITELLRSESAPNSFVIHAYCLMPDHLHFLAEGTNSASDLKHFVKSLKIKTSRHYSKGTGGRLWQREFYEHVLRSADSVESTAWYIWMNPVRKGLVASPQDYAFLGSFSGMKMPTAWSAPGWCPPWKKIRCTDS